MWENFLKYKDIITMIILFFSGFYWLHTNYPTKDDLKLQISILSCQVDKYMTLTQYQIENQNLEKEIQELNKFINASKVNNSILSPAMQILSDEKKQKQSENEKELKENQENMKEVTSELQKNVCAKVIL